MHSTNSKRIPVTWDQLLERRADELNNPLRDLIGAWWFPEQPERKDGSTSL